MTPRPRIVTPMNFSDAADGAPERTYLNDAYIRMVFAAGGLPVPAPPMDEFDPELADAYGADGVLLTGGADLDPALYGQSRHPKSTPLHERRQRSELAWFDWAQQNGVAVLGVCLGAQVINVARGGALEQYLPERPGLLDHGGGGKDGFHEVTACGESLRSILGAAPAPVNSRHRQAVAALGENLRVAARAPDGVVEGVEDTTGRFILGVQWHPEDIADTPATRAIMAAFLAAAANGR